MASSFFSSALPHQTGYVDRIFVLFAVRTATDFDGPSPSAFLLPLSHCQKDQSKDEEEKTDFSFSFSSLSKRRPGQWIVLFFPTG